MITGVVLRSAASGVGAKDELARLSYNFVLDTGYASELAMPCRGRLLRFHHRLRLLHHQAALLRPLTTWTSRLLIQAKQESLVVLDALLRGVVDTLLRVLTRGELSDAGGGP